MAIRLKKQFKCLVAGQEFINIRLRLSYEGCRNREYYKIICSYQVPERFDKKRPRHRPMEVLEELGWMDYLANAQGHRLFALDVSRIKHWLALGVYPTKPVAMALGLAGILPVHPESYLIAARNRDEIKKLKDEESEIPILIEPGYDKQYFTSALDVALKAKNLGDMWKY